MLGCNAGGGWGLEVSQFKPPPSGLHVGVELSIRAVTGTAQVAVMRPGAAHPESTRLEAKSITLHELGPRLSIHGCSRAAARSPQRGVSAAASKARCLEPYQQATDFTI